MLRLDLEVAAASPEPPLEWSDEEIPRERHNKEQCKPAPVRYRLDPDKLLSLDPGGTLAPTLWSEGASKLDVDLQAVMLVVPPVVWWKTASVVVY